MAKMIHSMVRVSNEEKSVKFYSRAFSLNVVDRLDFDDFVLVYMSNSETDFELELTINNSSIIQDNQASCDSIYLWNGNLLNLTGSYIDTLQSIYGCDSIVKLNLTLNSSPSSLTSQVICEGDSIKFGAITYSLAGMYTDTLLSSIGCDSLAILDLTITNLERR